MAKPKVPVASLSKMRSNIRDQKQTSAAKGPREQAKTLKSQQFVEDSSVGSSSSSSSGDDSDGDLDAAKKKMLANKAAKNKPANDKPKMNGVRPAAKPDAPSTSARKSVKNESKSESSSDSSASESEDESSDEEENTSNTKARSNGPKPTTKEPAANDVSDEGSSSESSSSSDEEAEGNKASSQKPSAPTTSGRKLDKGAQDKDNLAVAQTNGRTSRPQWMDTSDFTLRKASSGNPAKEVADFLSKENLKGKQVWYFTAPDSLPVTVLKDLEIDLTKATSGQKLLTHDGDGYGLDVESEATSTQIQLLVGSRQGGDEYSTVNRRIDSTVHIRRMAKFGPKGDDSATATDQYIPKTKAIREQPQGLKARYTPIGVPTPILPSMRNSATRSESDSDSEMSTGPASPMDKTSTPAVSDKIIAVTGSQKRKLTTDESPQPSASTKKHKKVDQFKDRLKAGRPTEHFKSSNPSLGSVPSSQPSLSTPSERKSKKDSKAKKDQTPDKKSKETPRSEQKNTPIPPPFHPLMARRQS
ncbi:DNA-directed RNA polymerase I subunit RPA34.5-domain-containing protein [Xylariaceae sp. FL0804]|nr:DNA-directed RNA polymerase I subunit RPA34.5-domain-containing protein [Xylariaceae sp. FL0804]